MKDVGSWNNNEMFILDQQELDWHQFNNGILTETVSSLTKGQNGSVLTKKTWMFSSVWRDQQEI